MTLSSKRNWFLPSALTLLCSFFISIPVSSQTQQDAAVKRMIVQRTAPNYPPLARSMALQGIVRLEAVVSPEGNVKDVAVKGGHPVLAQAATNSVRQWKWERAPHETRETVELRFDRPTE